MGVAYCLFDNLEVTDPAKLEVYKPRAAELVAKYGGRYLVIGGRNEIVEGDWKPNYPVMIEFPSMDAAYAWYNCDEYAEVKRLRHEAVRNNAVFIEGL